MSSSTATKRKRLSGNERKKINDKKKSAYGTQSLMNFVSKTKNVSESEINLDFENTNTNSTSLLHAAAGTQVQGLLNIDRRVDDKSNSVDPDVYANKEDTAELSNNDPDDDPQGTVDNATIELETVDCSPRDDEYKVSVSNSKQACLIDFNTDYPTDPALFENVAIKPSLLRAMLEAGPCQPGSDNRYEFESDDLGFKFKPNWYMKETKSGSVKRSWLVYSHRSQRMFCFSCILLADKKNVRTPYSDVWANPSLGVTRFRKRLEKINKHEKSNLHRQAENDLLLLKIRLFKDATVIHKLVESEKKQIEQNRMIVKRLIDVSLFWQSRGCHFVGIENTHVLETVLMKGIF